MFDEGQHSLTTVFCLFITWIGGWLLILSGIYFWRTGKVVSVSSKYPGPAKGAFGYYLPRRKPKREDLSVHVEQGPQVRWSGVGQLIIGISLLLLFISFFVSYWQTTQNPEARIIVTLMLAGLLPLLWYFGTPGERSEGQGEGGGEEGMPRSATEVNSAEENASQKGE